MAAMAPPRRIAVVALSDADEHDKIALLLYGIRAAGHVPILVDAAPFAAGAARLVPGGIAGMRVAGRAEIRGRHREAGGAIRTVAVGEVPVVTADPDATEVIPVDAVWPEALDITRRLAFEGLYRQIEEHRVPDGPLCLIEEDACGRYGPDRAVDPAALPAPTRTLAVEALAATGNRYGSVDIFGGEHAVAGEVNVMPGGHGPGFRDAVVGAVVAAYTRQLRLSPVVQGAVG
jgi:hypothetical protein